MGTAPIVLRICYALSSTDIGYATAHLLCAVHTDVGYAATRLLLAVGLVSGKIIILVSQLLCAIITPIICSTLGAFCP
eukprot:2247499-Rhodomonas_salina.1